jgi:hypothetical protein
MSMCSQWTALGSLAVLCGLTQLPDMVFHSHSQFLREYAEMHSLDAAHAPKPQSDCRPARPTASASRVPGRTGGARREAVQKCARWKRPTLGHLARLPATHPSAALRPSARAERSGAPGAEPAGGKVRQRAGRGAREIVGKRQNFAQECVARAKTSSFPTSHSA